MFKKLLVMIMMVLIAVTLFSCDNEGTQETAGSSSNGIDSTPSTSITVDITQDTVMTINGYDIKESVYKLTLYEEAEKLRSESVPEDIDGEQYDEWYANFFDTQIDGKSVIDIVKERTLNPLREYAYFMKALESKGTKFEESDVVDIETEELLLLGDEYNQESPDEYFVYTYEVTKQQYLDFKVSQRLIEKYKGEDAVNQMVTEEQIAEYKSIFGDFYTIKTMRSIFLAAATQTEASARLSEAQAILTRISNGEDMKALVAQFSEDGTTNEGLFVVSNEESEYPSEILDWAMGADINSSGIVTAEDGVYILRCEDVKYNDDEIKRAIGIEMIEEKAGQEYTGDAYLPVMNEAVYSKYTKLPGDLMPGATVG